MCFKCYGLARELHSLTDSKGLVCLRLVHHMPVIPTLHVAGSEPIRRHHVAILG